MTGAQARLEAAPTGVLRPLLCLEQVLRGQQILVDDNVGFLA